jgi:hypothetical protein
VAVKRQDGAIGASSELKNPIMSVLKLNKIKIVFKSVFYLKIY